MQTGLATKGACEFHLKFSLQQVDFLLFHFHGLFPFFAIEMKLTFSSPVATAKFSKFAGILSAALSQHHLLGFEKAQLEFHHLH